ncbi:HalOD1 output domain-containing protein [Halobium salinum]|uniref:HalOD1 output domain-containing protein n=1 Tax=Halobium salinum TaxID=1364940 RepID=A0ABD5P965_9EURY|nr:HalOD1 output domain-containing protein [Halobium salinum]
MTTDTPPREPSASVTERQRNATTHLGTTVAFAVSDATGVPVTELDVVLNDYVDPDALHALFAPKDDGTPRPQGSVSFTVGDCEVTVFGDHRVVATPSGPGHPGGSEAPDALDGFDAPDRTVHADGDYPGGDGSAPV